ncbi:hypothetical protein HRR83_000837 [Exophiala dermatitidis]|uniref:Major facilitator superfamily (MFS) profile domain-containing protein n=1 Tax=Exophiala dermatitidis TaxID=5970 RepID=A0AAN6IZ73_EXODE|nr:hypothetical protein HRR75_000757 [Exophiala dermatitidis]KAJ4528086.1 hypothetical protein HRR74_000841 [Exophiala dermatitidis]KAJ4528719.1 hypothetical protein HRR73_001342 [Exophiala dermatitidis]KAJ4530103.1 hypothetical protein HRR76_009338 [Exophiala dermatitidis]KAJ4553054.1 hypothetical protein HRR78_003313 [Exophiala dermatitidis]
MATVGETQPLLGGPDLQREDTDHQPLPATQDAVVVVAFDPDGDEDNPQDWPAAYKWGIVALLAFMAFTVTFTCISVVPVSNRIVDDLSHGHSSKSASVLLVTIWELGESAGPLLIAPLSEMFGRYPVFNVANVLFIGATILAALCQTTPLFIGARALTGLAVASNVLSPAIVGDMFVSDQRGSAMSMIMFAPLLGGAVSPAIAGLVAESLGWRQVLWMSVILAGICEVVFLTCFRETYKVAILKRRADKLRRSMDLHRGPGLPRPPIVFADADMQTESHHRFWDSIMRPAVVFGSSTVLQVMSLSGSLMFAFFYIMSTSLPDILEGIYGLSPAKTGSTFIAFSAGSAISVVIINRLLDRIYVSLRVRNKGLDQPEYRLPLVIVGGFSVPLVVALYGWTAQIQLPVWVLVVTLVLLGSTTMLAFIPLLAYVVDAFKLHSASALTAVIVTRCLMGTFLPLATQPLVSRFGWGWGFMVFAAASLAMAPIPVLVFKFGARWRRWSRYTCGSEE